MSQPQLTVIDFDPFASALARAVPTTEAQREVWLADQIGREASLAYNESVSLVVKGPLDVAALQQALLALSNRHEALRATFSADGMHLLISTQGSLAANVVGLEGMDEAQRARALADARRQAVSEPFDLVNGPLARATLLASGSLLHELIITAHHIVCDGWSFGVVASELISLYAAIARGEDAAGTLSQPDSFGNYALAQNSSVYQEQAEADAHWWVQQFDSGAPVLELPTDRPRLAFRSFDSLREDVVLDARLVDGVRRLGQKHGASLFATMLAVFGGLIARLSGQDDIVIGVPSAGQASGGHNALVGHCVQLLPIRLAVDLEQPFPNLVKATRGRVLDAYEHQSCTFGQLLKKLKIERTPGRPPLVSVLFNIDQAISREALSVAGLDIALHSNPRLFENFELFVNASQRGGEIVVECQYNTALFDGETIRRWLALYREALVRLVAAPVQQTIAALAPTEADLALLARFNDSALEHPRELAVHALIERQVAATPERVAVIAGGQRLTYRELDRRANALAQALSERGVKQGDLVGLACGRNAHMLVGLFGILKTGAGYVPMDPAFPTERLAYMRTQSEASIVVCDGSVADTLQFGDAERLVVDALGERETFASPVMGKDDVAYVIYTSGSTGDPKGVRVPHRSVANLLASVTREPGMRADNVVLSVTTLSFDIAVSEVILPLTTGARIVVASREQAADGDQLRALIESEGVDFIDATPSTWRLLIAAGWAGGPRIKAICTGEPLPPDLGREILPRVGELWNGYGPTETTVWSSFHRVLSCNGTVPIGHPVANTQLHVVDAKLRPVPVGVVGEIFIGGEGVTLGYQGRPDLTAERFLPHPNRPGRAWYKTGDLGRWRADGVLECLGRTDHQVKVRGYRIELGEIEANLGKHPEVDRCVAITREDEPGDVRLVAYAVSKGQKLDSSQLRDFVRQTLPYYMIPSFVMQIDAIPLLPNGKIDRSKLPRPEMSAGTGASEDKEPARNPLEAKVLRAMEDVLKLPGLGVKDDFFALGGHSLLAAKLTSRLNQDLGLSMPLRTIFEAPTAEGMALAIDKARSAGLQGYASLAHQVDQSFGPLTLMQDRIRLIEEMNPGRVIYNAPSAHRLKGPLDFNCFRAAFNLLVDRNPALRTFIDSAGGQAVQRVLPALAVEIPFEDLSGLPAASRETELLRRMQEIIDRPIKISRAPIFRVGLWRLADEEHVFLFMPHHIMWDGWSFDLFYQEMAALYPAALGLCEVSQPPPGVTYIDYAVWQQQWLSSAACQAQVAYWRQRFRSIDTPGALPTDRPRRPSMTGEGASEWMHVDRTLTERLRRVAQDNGATLNMLVMAMYVAMIGQATSSRSTVIGVPVRGRQMPEVESVMGFFNNLLPVHFQPKPEASLSAWLAVVKSALLDAFAHQDVPFELLAGEPEIAKHTTQLYQTLFSFQDARERLRQWGPLQQSVVLAMQKGATQDLGIWIMEVPDGLEGVINYNAELFEARTACLFRDRLVGLLLRVANTPDATLDALLAAPAPDTDAFNRWIEARRSLHPAESPSRNTAPTADAGSLPGSQLRLAKVWADLIGIDVSDIGPHDNFFDLGGNSMLAIKALLIFERDFGLRIEPARMVRETLSQIAATPATKARSSAEPAAQTQAADAPAAGPLASLWQRLGRR
jgi:amino acid adenylation domain-containing protein